MDVSWLIILMSAAVLISIVLLAIICLDCRNKGSITQSTSEEYVSSGFIAIRPFTQHTSTFQNPIPNSPSNHNLRPFPDPAKPGIQPRPYTPTETESNPSYENNAGPEMAESEVDDPGYIEVIPDDAPRPADSRASTPSSDHNYVNLESDDEKSDYLNVNPSYYPIQTADISAQSSSDEEDEEANYVNQPMGLVNI